MPNGRTRRLRIDTDAIRNVVTEARVEPPQRPDWVIAPMNQVHMLLEQNLIQYGEIRFMEGGAIQIDRNLVERRRAERAEQVARGARQLEQAEAYMNMWSPESMVAEIARMHDAELSSDSTESDDDFYEDSDSCEPTFRDDDEDYDDTPKWKTIKADDFPAYEIPAWSSADERERVTDLYFKHIEYRLRWIFFREEKEGFRRRSHGIQPFNRQDFLDKIAKRGIEHALNTATSTFYDWNIGATDFILRLENFEVDGNDALRIHFIYKPNNLELGYQDRLWDGHYYQPINQQWAEIE